MLKMKNKIVLHIEYICQDNYNLVQETDIIVFSYHDLETWSKKTYLFNHFDEKIINFYKEKLWYGYCTLGLEFERDFLTTVFWQEYYKKQYILYGSYKLLNVLLENWISFDNIIDLQYLLLKYPLFQNINIWTDTLESYYNRITWKIFASIMSPTKEVEAIAEILNLLNKNSSNNKFTEINK